jgi:hypothetical protein
MLQIAESGVMNPFDCSCGGRAELPGMGTMPLPEGSLIRITRDGGPPGSALGAATVVILLPVGGKGSW